MQTDLTTKYLCTLAAICFLGFFMTISSCVGNANKLTSECISKAQTKEIAELCGNFIN